MRTGILVEVTAAERDRLEAIVADRNSPQKHVWRAGIVLATADGLGTVAIMRHTAKSKTVVWRWQERFAQEGVDGLLRDKTRPSRVKPFGPEVAERIVAPALAQTHRGLPVKKGRAGTLAHDYRRHGTTTLFAALDVLEGKVIGRCMQRHRHQEFIRFLNTIEAELPAGKLVHVILDNYATHQHPKVRAWLKRHPRFVF